MYVTMHVCNRHIVLVQVSEEEQVISYGCTTDQSGGCESYCADAFFLPIDTPLRNKFGSVTTPALVNFITMNIVI